MHSPKWSDDDELMRDLNAALRPVPSDPHVIDAARAAQVWLGVDVDLELAELLHDSFVDAGSPVRGPAGAARMLVFGRGPVGVEIELSDGGIEGQLMPPGPGLVRLFTATGCTVETTADHVGCFWFPTRPKGPIRLGCVGLRGRFTTSWMIA
jgi:hypothetical protein